MAKAKATKAAKAKAVRLARAQALEAKALVASGPPQDGLRKAFSPHGLREGLLTFGAVAGVVCMLLAVAAFAFDVRPVIFRSGSMAPAIDTGALALSRTTDAKDLAIGDIVTVKTGAGVRVTHRIENLSLSGDKATLILRGDANKVPDEKAYVVKGADRVLFDIPKAGYVVSWLSGPGGIFAGGLLVGFLLLTAFGPGTRTERRPGTKRLFGVSAATLAIGVMAGGVSGPTSTQAYYTDSAALAGGMLSAAPKPGSPVITGCSGANGSKPFVVDWAWGPGNPNGGFRFFYTNLESANAALTSTIKAANQRSMTTPDINSQKGTFNVVAIVDGVESLPATANFTAQGEKTCTF